MRIHRLSAFILGVGLILASCEKTEDPVTLPAKGQAEVMRVDMGEDYADQVFFDFETNSIVSTSKVNSWDLAFETTADGKHVFINGGKDIFVLNTHTSDITSTEYLLPKSGDKSWSFDAPGGSGNATAIGEWSGPNNISNNEVYIIKLNPTLFADTFKKIKLVSVDPSQYVMTYADMRSKEVKTIVIPKDPAYNYAFFSFDNGGVISYPEPPKDSWDVVFTRYRHIYTELENFPYLVSGVLLNPYNTRAAEDSTAGYSSFTTASIATAKFYTDRDVIGYDWKSYDLDKGRYSVNTKKGFIIQTRKDQFWKLHFLDFYNDQGVKGSPSFEFERLQ
jgi:hypothetical protein